MESVVVLDKEESLEGCEGIAIGDYLLRSKLSGGGGGNPEDSSLVWKAEHKTTGEFVALKIIHYSKLTTTLKNCLNCEVNFLSSVRHPNIIRLFDVFQLEGCIYLILEFCAGGNLATYIQNHGRVQEYSARRFMQQIAAGLKVLKSYNIIHRDLKPENLLLSGSDGDPVLKIADFGLSRVLNPDDVVSMCCGTPLYMAPEILQFQKYDEKVDVWSVGVILFELLNGFPPFTGRSNVQLLQNIKTAKSLPFSHLVFAELRSECIDLCSRLLCVNPVNRLSFDDFYHHDFFK